jgi:pyridoxamine 5'-phosphate oxidase family protein
MVLTELEVAYLASQKLGRLATVQRNGQPQASPVSFGWNAALSAIEIPGFRMAGTQKFRNIATNPLVAFVVDDVVSTDPWTVRCLEIRGHAAALERPSDAVIALGDGAIIRIQPLRIISWGIDPEAPGRRTVASPAGAQ